jgi:hypothetical protein
MPKKERKETEQLAKSDYAKTQAETQAFISGREQERTAARQRTEGLYSDLSSGYEGAKGLVSNISGMIPTGGYDQSQIDYLRGAMASAGAGSPEEADVYRSFATTGGYTPEQEAAYMRQATRGARDVYDVLGQEAQRRRALTGGFGGGDISQMARQASQATAEAATKARLGLEEEERTRRLAGAAGLGGISARQLSAAGTQAGMEADIAAGRRAAAGTAAQTELGRLSGLSGVLGMSQEDAQSIANEILQRYATSGQISQQDLSTLADLSKQPGWFSGGLVPALGGIAGVGSAALGIGGIRGLGKTSPIKR